MERELSEIQKYYYEQYLPELQQRMYDSEEKVDKKVFTICIGALGLLTTILCAVIRENISVFTIIMAVLTAIFFVISLCKDIEYHKKSLKFQHDQYYMVYNFMFATDDPNNDTPVANKIKQDNSKLSRMFNWTFYFMLAGIVSFIIFAFSLFV